VLFYVLFVCICVLYYCHRVATQLQLTNISYHILFMFQHHLLVCFLRFSQTPSERQWLVFVMKTECVFCEIEIQILCIIYIDVSLATTFCSPVKACSVPNTLLQNCIYHCKTVFWWSRVFPCLFPCFVYVFLVCVFCVFALFRVLFLVLYTAVSPLYFVQVYRPTPPTGNPITVNK